MHEQIDRKPTIRETLARGQAVLLGTGTLSNLWREIGLVGWGVAKFVREDEAIWVASATRLHRVIAQELGLQNLADAGILSCSLENKSLAFEDSAWGLHIPNDPKEREITASLASNYLLPENPLGLVITGKFK